MRKFLISLVVVVIFTGIIFFFKRNKSEEFSDTDKDKALRELLSDWRLTIQVPYKVTRYKELSIRNQWGTKPMYFELGLPKEKTNAWSTLLSEPKLKVRRLC
jgi:hypothetical protein